MQTSDRPRLGERIAAFAMGLMGTWTALLMVLLGTLLWWQHAPPPGGWARAIADDAYPFVFWGNVVSLLTLIDIILVRMAQVAQQKRDEAREASQTAILRAVNAQNQAIAALLERHVRQERGGGKGA